ncbi:hypothetical protein C8J57DRAFT_1114948 [Mycena rebaudengoi]|nr:hypothetical protein C8J57DRAFT_1114948 [Mycena rebaudengoi]
MDLLQGELLKQNATFTSDLPTELWIVIMSFLEPLDLLNLRMVSKSLCEVAHQRIVWIDAARQVCIRHEICLASFPFAEMGLSELEHIAIAPKRFATRLRREFSVTDSPKVAPHRTRTLTSVDGPAEQFENVRLIPGGRFLVTTSRCNVRLWDLGIGPISLDRAVPIASKTMEGVIQSTRLRASPAGSEVLVIFLSVVNEIFDHIDVLSIVPSEDSPQFRRFAPTLFLPVNGPLPVIHGCSQTHIAIHTAACIVLWNFVTDNWVSWPSSSSNSDDIFYFSNNSIVTVRGVDEQIQVLSLPTLQPRHSVSDAVPHMEEPPQVLQSHSLCRFNSPVPLSRSISGLTLGFHGREISTPEQPMHIDILSEDVDGAVVLTHFASPVLGEQASEGHSTYQHVALGENLLRGTTYNACHSMFIEWVGRNTVHSFVVQESMLHMCISDLDSSPPRTFFGILTTPSIPTNELNIDFCSFSGRVCFRTLTASGRHEIIVLDYLAPAPKQPDLNELYRVLSGKGFSQGAQSNDFDDVTFYCIR